MRTTPLLLVLLAVSGCFAPAGPSESEIIAKIEADRAWYQAAFEREREALADDFETPHELQYEGKGTIIVHKVELRGGPERPLVHVRFTYVNTTGHDIPIPIVRFVYHLPDGSEYVGDQVELSRPIGMRFGNGNAHSSWLDSPTGDLHLQRGWTWSLEVEFPGEDQ